MRSLYNVLAVLILAVLQGPVVSSEGETSPADEELLQQTEAQYHRSLALFVLPFQLLWRIRIGNGFPGPDRQPTPAEYQGVRRATIEWYSQAIPDYYAGESFTFDDITCSLNTTVTTWDPSLSFPHQILFDCEVFWDADTIEEIPTIDDFLLDMQADYPFDEFTQQFLWNANPQNPRSLFQFSEGVGYTTNDFGPARPGPGAGTPPPVGSPAPVTAPPVGVPAPVTAPPVGAPAPVTAPPVGGPTLPQRKDPPEAKCGSLANLAGRGGAAAKEKGCSSRLLRKVKLKGSSSNKKAGV